MTCWLRFLQEVSDMLKRIEPDLYKRKQLAISVLKELEMEKGHNVNKIRKAIDEEGAEGIRRRAKKKRGERSEERVGSEAATAEAYS